MLIALLDGRARTARELADCAGVTPQTASMHVAKLVGCGFVRMEKQGPATVSPARSTSDDGRPAARNDAPRSHGACSAGPEAPRQSGRYVDAPRAPLMRTVSPTAREWQVTNSLAARD